MDLIFETDVANDPKDVRRAMIGFRNALRGSAAEEVTGNAETVLAEVLNNIVEHAMVGCGTAGEIHVLCGWDGHALEVEVVDNGSPLPGGVCPARSMPELGKLETLPEGGFGWALVCILARDLGYRRANGKNHLVFRIPETA